LIRVSERLILASNQWRAWEAKNFPTCRQPGGQSGTDSVSLRKERESVFNPTQGLKVFRAK
jgi:hypothetical protein